MTDQPPQAPEAGLQAPPPPRRAQTTVAEYLESLLVTVLLALFGTSFVVQAFKIPSASMEGTLLIGDHLLVNKFIFGGRGGWYEKFLPYRPIERGDIIVFKYPFGDHQYFVKRVIGLPGDRLRIEDKQVYVNEKPLAELYVVHDDAAPYDPFNYDFPPTSRQPIPGTAVPEWAREIRKHISGGELVVPAGKYFAMGDNRDRSSDSRFWGFVDREAIMGRPFLVYWSVNATSEDYRDSTFWSRAGWILHTLMHLPSRTRWNRMMRTVH